MSNFLITVHIYSHGDKKIPRATEVVGGKDLFCFQLFKAACANEFTFKLMKFGFGFAENTVAHSFFDDDLFSV